jgi:hypothetical protein
MTAATSGHLPRLLNEQFGQALSTAVGFLDRLVLTGILYRVWGEAGFEQWSAIIAFAGFASLFEFGFNLYYNNRITFETERGQLEAARRTLFEANAVSACCALAGLILLPLFGYASGWVAPSGTASDLAATFLLTAAACLRLATMGMNALYRANRAYARFIMLATIAELARIVAIGIAVLLGSDLLTVAVISFLVQMIIPVAAIVWDSTLSFAPYRIGFGIPRGARLREALTMSGAYFGQLVPVVLWTSAPVLVLQGLGSATGVLAAFVLVRTLANLARAPLQSFGIVIGQECGRRVATNDKASALAALAGGARMFAVLAGLACGVVAFGGPALVKLWTGDSGVFSFALALAAVTPMAFGAVALLATIILVASNAPFLGLVARWLQLAVTVLAWFALPDLDAGLRMMVALCVGEVLGHQPVTLYALQRLIPGSGIGFYLRYLALTLISAAFAACACHVALTMVGGHTATQNVAALGVAGLACLGWALLTAVDRQTRHRLADIVSTRVFGRSQP